MKHIEQVIVKHSLDPTDSPGWSERKQNGDSRLLEARGWCWGYPMGFVEKGTLK